MCGNCGFLTAKFLKGAKFALFFDHPKAKKLSVSRSFARDPTQGSSPWTPVGSPRPLYRLAVHVLTMCSGFSPNCKILSPTLNVAISTF